MSIRLADQQDIPVIDALRMQLLREVADTIPPELPEKITAYLEQHLRDGSCVCALAEIHGRPAAKAMLCLYDAMPDEAHVSGRYARLFSVYTLPEFRGHGLMEHLLALLLKEAQGRGIQQVFASAEPLAVPLYKRLGFSVLDTEMSWKP